MGKRDDADAKGEKGKGDQGKGKGKGKKVKRPPGPLAPWRLSIVVAVSAITTGQALLDAAQTGIQLDLALMRSFGVAFVLWIVLGKINRVLGDAQAESAAAAASHLQLVPHADAADQAEQADANDAGQSGRAA